MSAAARGYGLHRSWRPEALKPLAATALISALTVASLLWFPLAALTACVALALGAWMWRDRNAVVLVLAALMVNVKINYYTGFVTLFPEYPLLALAGAVMLLRGMGGEPGPGERGFATLFVWFIAAGAISAVNAVEVARVASKGVLLCVAAAVFFSVLRGVRTRRELGRTLATIEVFAAVSAAYDIMQIVGGAIGWDTSLRFFEKYSNPEFVLGVGAPVVYQFIKTFRANAFFNDPNILGGYLAAAMSLTLARSLARGAGPAHRLRARVGFAQLLLMGVCLLLTVSRSGFLGFGSGAACVFAFMPGALRRPSFLWALGAGAAIVIGGAVVAGINPVLLAVRLGQTFEAGDLSSRTHLLVGQYALDLLRRFPFTGVGLRNFGAYYGAEVDAYGANMMAHNAWLDFSAETGLFGGLAFTALTVAVLRRPWKQIRHNAPLRDRDPERHAALVGLFAAMVALDVANVFYDYYLRTFIWVFAGLAVAAARVPEDEKAAGAP
jgi:O-antigen ligase